MKTVNALAARYADDANWIADQIIIGGRGIAIWQDDFGTWMWTLGSGEDPFDTYDAGLDAATLAEAKAQAFVALIEAVA